MKFIERDTFHICGYAVETDAAHNADDLDALYTDFFGSKKDSLLRKHGGKAGFYGLMWYTQGHERYGYLLGMEVGTECELPAGSVRKTLPKTTYAVSRYPHEKDAIEAWSEFFFTDIPKEGYAPNEQMNLYFEFFPKNVDGNYELWVPVVKPMYERLLDKKNEPTANQIADYVGAQSAERLKYLEEHLQANYHLVKELRFPFGNNYGWGYQYSHKSTHLCYAFFEADAFTVMLQIGDTQAPAVEDIRGALSSKAQALWTNRYPCGKHGGWIHYRVLHDDDLRDIYTLIEAKKKPLQAK